MSAGLTSVHAQNFRSLADVSVEMEPLSVLFGPNGAGKSTFLDTIWFLRDCAIRGVDRASSDRSHGIGALWDGADEGANITIRLETESARYEVLFGYSSGRIEPFVGEVLESKQDNRRLVDRKVGSDQATYFHKGLDQPITVKLREPEKLALTSFLLLDQDSPEGAEIDQMLRFVHFYHARSADFFRLRKIGSESSYQTYVWDRYQNLWSVLRNLHDRRGVDERYDTIIAFMRKSFPSSFSDLLMEQTGPDTVYGSFIEKQRRDPIQASGVSDGHLQMLAHLTCLFSEGRNRPSLILFDEPELSLHPYALSILAKAMRVASSDWNKQIVVSTHSPVLISQFEPEEILAAELAPDGRTVLTRVSEIEGIEDLLENYAAGSLYMAEMIAPQSGKIPMEASS